MLRESAIQARARIILYRRILYRPKRVLCLFLFCGSTFFSFGFVDHGYVCLLVPALRHLLLGLLLFRRGTSLPFVLPIYSWPRLNRVRLERDCNTIAFPRSSSLHTVNAWFCYFIGSPLFKLTHSSVKAWYVYKSLEGENSHLFFERIPSL